MENKQLAVVEQLPLIRQYFEEIYRDVAKKTETAMNLVVTDDNVKDIKKIRAELNKEFQNYEFERKEIKRQILGPYEKFEKEYKDTISSAFSAADNCLKKKIEESENIIKSEKEKELREYFKELIESKHIAEYVKFEDLGIKVNLSDSNKKIMREINDKVDSIYNDIMMINLEQDKEDILVEYLIDFNFARAKITVLKRKEAAIKIKQNQEIINKEIEEENTRIEELEKAIIIPKAEKITDNNDVLIVANFKVKGTRTKLLELREYINENGLEIIKD